MCFFFFNDTPTTEIYTLSLHDALPISRAIVVLGVQAIEDVGQPGDAGLAEDELELGILRAGAGGDQRHQDLDRKSTRLNSSHTVISYAVFCLKKKKQKNNNRQEDQGQQ